MPVLAVPMLVSALTVLVQAPSTASPTMSDDSPAVELLRRSAIAGDRVSYTGTQYVSTWSAVTTSAASTSAIVQVRHQAGGRTEIHLHDKQTAILYGRAATSWLAGDSPVELLLGAYDVRLAGAGRVAGRSTDIVEALRADGSVAVRLWLDRQTALSLRRESFAYDGYPLSASAFIDIDIGAPSCCEFNKTRASSSSHGSMLRWSDIEELRDQGWHCPNELSDGMVLYEAQRLGDAIQLSYSDGVMSVSVFEQPGRLDPYRLNGYSSTQLGHGVVYSRPGPPARLTWSSGGHVITVVAEAPLETVEALFQILPPERPWQPSDQKNGWFDRVGRGAQRVGSWLNPFD
jgi:sigma-E factor negative regulatory protein RseB